MTDKNIFDILRPKANKFVPNETGSSYRPKSKDSNRLQLQKKTIALGVEVEKQSQRSNGSKSTRRVVMIRRNGKKPEEIDDDYNRTVTRFDKTQQILSLRSSYTQFPKKHDRYPSEVTSEVFEKANSPNFNDNLDNKTKSTQNNFNLNILNNYQNYDKQAQSPKNTEPYLCVQEADTGLLDHISLSDPIWSNIIPENILQNNDLERLIDDNPDYFNHQLGMCACFRCKCGSCRCEMGNQIKLKVNGALMSIYGKDFGPKQANDMNAMQPLNQPMYETRFLDQKTIDLISQHQSQFNHKEIPKIERYKATFQPAIGNLSNMSTYRQNFGNWGAKDHMIFKRSEHISTSDDLPFVAKSRYQENFCKTDHKKQEQIILFKSNLSPLPSGPFISTTTSERAFIAFKVGQQQRLPPPEQILYQKTPVFNGQFKTTVARDFQGEKEDHCPATTYKKQWKQKLLQKYKQLRDQRDQNLIAVK